MINNLKSCVNPLLASYNFSKLQGLGNISFVSNHLGINYYHESMGYLAVDNAGIDADFDTIEELFASVDDVKIKVYHSPYLNGGGVSSVDSLAICKNITEKAKGRGYYVVWVENHDDGANPLNGNGSGAYSWEEYSTLVIADSLEAEDSGADEFLVGNEVSLHNDDDSSYYSDVNLPIKVKALVTSCKSNFSGLVGYEDGWWKDGAWYSAGLGSLDKIYFTLYEAFDLFKSSVDSIYSHFGSYAELGEVSTRSGKSALNHDEMDWSIHLMRKLDYARSVGLGAWLFTFRSSTDDSFDLIQNSTGIPHDVWNLLTRGSSLICTNYIYNDFSSGMQDFSGDGSVVGGRLRCDAFANACVSGYNYLTDYVFRGIINIVSVSGEDSWRSARLIFRYLDNDNYYFMSINPNEEKIQVFRRLAGNESFVAEVTLSSIELSTDYYFEIRISGSGSNTLVEIFWDSEKIISTTDGGNTTLNTGMAGLKNNGAVADVDNVFITGIERLI